MSSSSKSLRSVDRLTVTFLVDNCIEWFTKLPPGFTHELPQHLQESHHPTIDPVTGTPLLDFDRFCCGAHGFSALIETEINGETPRLTLFDTGPDSLSLVRNIAAMHIPVHKIDRVITSHWHSDHTGGLLSFLSLRNGENAKVEATIPCTIDVHPDRPIARGIAPGPNFDKVICRLPDDPTFEQMEAIGGVVEKHDEGHAVQGGTVWVSSEVPRVTSYETGIPGGMRWVGEGEQGKWINEEAIMDERYAAIDVVGKGLVLFSACSHAGIVNVIKDAVKTFSRPIYMVIGGLHLAGDSVVPRISPTVKFLSSDLRPSPAYVLPMHCSGFLAKVALEEALGNGVVPAGVGMKVEVTGDREMDKRLSAPIIQE